MSTEPPSIFDSMSAMDATIKDDSTIKLPDPSEKYSPEMIKEMDYIFLAAMVADNLFGDELDDTDEYLFLAAMLDETDALQSELITKLTYMFEMQKYAPPDYWSIQIFKRKAGFRPSRNDPDFGNYCMAVCLKDYQLVVYDGQEYPISVGQTTPCFELLSQPESKKEKPAPRPSVPKNRVKIVNYAGKPGLKPRHYWSILVWAFWDDAPINSGRQASEKGIKKAMEAVQEKLNDMEIRSDEIEEKMETTNETVLYDATQ